jgi:hypothetical protein
MSRRGYEPTSPVFERVKTVYALDRATTVIGSVIQGESKLLSEFPWLINGILDNNLELPVYVMSLNKI